MKVLAFLPFAAAVALAQGPPPPTITTGQNAPDPNKCNVLRVGDLYARSENYNIGPVHMLRCTQTTEAFAWNPVSHLVVSSLPTKCSTGDLAFLTGVTAGQNVYGCAPADTWTLVGSGGSNIWTRDPSIITIYPTITGDNIGNLGTNNAAGGGDRNTAVGAYAGDSTNSGSDNVSVGYDALTANTNGNANTAVGYAALTANTTGGNNVAMGILALSQNISSSDNVAIGTNALLTSTAASNTGLGHHAGTTIVTTTFGTFVGNGADQSDATTRTFNTAIGAASRADCSNCIVLGRPQDVIKGMERAFSAVVACSSDLAGSIAPISDSSTATWGATITGGGANHVLGYCNGTNWTVAAK
jgi:hypothetical protein